MSPNETLQYDTVQSSLNLSCTVVNNGTFHWAWTGPGVNNAVFQQTATTRTSILMLSNISAADAGNYTCSVSYLAFGDNPGFTVPEMSTSTNINLILNSELLLLKLRD